MQLARLSCNQMGCGLQRTLLLCSFTSAVGLGLASWFGRKFKVQGVRFVEVPAHGGLSLQIHVLISGVYGLGFRASLWGGLRLGLCFREFFCATQVSATSVKRGYTAALGKPPPPPREDGGQPAPKNSERDAHRLFSRLGLSLKMPIRTKTFAVDDGQAVEMHYIRIADWVKYLLKTPSLLAGAGTEKLESQCRAFWTMYKWHHPDHVIYQDEDKLSTTLPLLLYGDEGKGPRRGNYMVTTIELPETTCTLLCVCRFVEPSLKYCFSSETDHKGVQWVANEYDAGAGYL